MTTFQRSTLSLASVLIGVNSTQHESAAMIAEDAKCLSRVLTRSFSMAEYMTTSCPAGWRCWAECRPQRQVVAWTCDKAVQAGTKLSYREWNTGGRRRGGSHLPKPCRVGLAHGQRLLP